MAVEEVDLLPWLLLNYAHIHSANNTHVSLYSVSFDLENAFPRVWRHLILTILQKYDLRDQLPLQLHVGLSFLLHIPRQGKWPTLIYTHSRQRHLPRVPVKRYIVSCGNKRNIQRDPIPPQALLFVDDLSIHMQSDNVNHCHRTLQNTINLIQAWLSARGFRISPLKSATMTFRKLKSKITPPPPPWKSVDACGWNNKIPWYSIQRPPFVAAAYKWDESRMFARYKRLKVLFTSYHSM